MKHLEFQSGKDTVHDNTATMPSVCGIDGCRAGWLALFKDLDTGSVRWRLLPTAWELSAAVSETAATGIDIPIGLPDRGARLCDREARRLLGRGRASSVFPAPIRPVLPALSYEEACDLRSRIEQKKLSHQLWNIVPKIREVDEALRTDASLQSKLREVHPELSFYALAGERPMRYNKKTQAGRDERLRVLEPVFGRQPITTPAERRAMGSAEDDVLDAFAVLWTAERIVRGVARTIPTLAPLDSEGLRMEIVV